MGCELNEIAPDFVLSDQYGKRVRLSSQRGQWVLLYFYPKDDTPGCTTEACSLQERFPDFLNRNFKVLGVSPDSVLSHRKFAERFNLSFSLLSDPSKEVIHRYHAWGPKIFLGKEVMGVVRRSFLIDPEGRIVKVYPQVDPKGHALEVWQDFQELSLGRMQSFHQVLI